MSVSSSNEGQNYLMNGVAFIPLDLKCSDN